MTKEEHEITEIVNRETKAWNTQDVNLLISIFHPDMVWTWPKTSSSHLTSAVEMRKLLIGNN